MCGIAGTVDLRGLSRDATQPLLAGALARLAPRGPDGDDVWFDARCAFGHRRLAVIDLSANASQPMRRDEQVITFNGEIYNFAELRKELAAAGQRFSTQSDTEVLLAGWQHWGPALLPRLNGMFAFAIWDAKAGALWLARDRFGKKPLLYWPDGAQLAFASDLIALEQLIGRTQPLDPAALRWLFTLRYIPEPFAAVKDVAKLPPGCVLRFSERGLQIEKWHQPAPSPALSRDAPAAARQLAATVDSAVADRLVADVPVGAFLSGGIDSAIVTACMARHAGTVRTFTVGFENAADYYEERPAAREVASFLGTQHTEIALDESECLRSLDDVFRAFDEPFADSSAVASYAVARETRRHVTVALSGDGADEVFGGYRKYQGELYAGLYGAIPAVLRRGVIEPLVARLPENKDSTGLEMLRRIRRFVAHAGADADARHAGWMELMPAGDLQDLLGGRAPDLPAFIRSHRRAVPANDAINALLAIDVRTVLPSDMLVKVDRSSMANSLEVRCPFLDPRVVDLAFGLAGSLKLKRGAGKWILRQAFADRLPASVFARPKKGFEVPIARWLRGQLRDLVARSLDPVRLRRQGLFNPDICAAWLADLESGRRDRSWQIWTMIAFQQWATVHRRPEAMA